MPPNYHQDRPIGRADRKPLLASAAAVAMVCAGLGAWATLGGSSGPQQKGRCVTVSFASATGGVYAHQCGLAARDWCAEEAKGTGSAAQQVQAACRLEDFLPPGTAQRLAKPAR